MQRGRLARGPTGCDPQLAGIPVARACTAAARASLAPAHRMLRCLTCHSWARLSGKPVRAALLLLGGLARLRGYCAPAQPRLSPPATLRVRHCMDYFSLANKFQKLSREWMSKHSKAPSTLLIAFPSDRNASALSVDNKHSGSWLRHSMVNTAKGTFWLRGLSPDIEPSSA